MKTKFNLFKYSHKYNTTQHFNRPDCLKIKVHFFQNHKQLNLNKSPAISISTTFNSHTTNRVRSVPFPDSSSHNCSLAFTAQSQRPQLHPTKCSRSSPIPRLNHRHCKYKSALALHCRATHTHTHTTRMQIVRINFHLKSFKGKRGRGEVKSYCIDCISLHL